MVYTFSSHNGLAYAPHMAHSMPSASVQDPLPFGSGLNFLSIGVELTNE